MHLAQKRQEAGAHAPLIQYNGNGVPLPQPSPSPLPPKGAALSAVVCLPAVHLPSPYAITTRLLVSSCSGLSGFSSQPGGLSAHSEGCRQGVDTPLVPVAPPSCCHCPGKDHQALRDGFGELCLWGLLAPTWVSMLGLRWSTVAQDAGGDPNCAFCRSCLPIPMWGTVAEQPRCAS